MSKLIWDAVGQRTYETGVDHGVLYIPNSQGAFDRGVAWNGLTTVTEKPSGAEATPVYADNIKYLNLVSAEEFGATIEAFTYPLEFQQFDGFVTPTAGVTIGQQGRRTFGLAYRTLLGNDILGTDWGYKLHLIWGCLAAPTEKAHATVNDSPEAMPFSWELTTTAVAVPGFKPTATLTIDSTQVDPAKLLEVETVLYGAVGVEPSLPDPFVILTAFGSTTAQVTPTAPTYDSATKTISIPTITGVEYQINNIKRTGNVVITTDTVVVAKPINGYTFPAVTDNDWLYKFA